MPKRKTKQMKTSSIWTHVKHRFPKRGWMFQRWDGSLSGFVYFNTNEDRKRDKDVTWFPVIVRALPRRKARKK